MIMTILPGWKNIAGSIWNISIVFFSDIFAGMKLHASVFLRRQMRKMRDEIGTCLNVASLKQYGKEMADKGFSE